jgi:putative ABC transport system permease protein
VAGDVKLHLEEQYEPTFYIPYGQLPYPKDATYTTYFFDMRWSNLAVKTSGDPMNVAAGVRREVLTLDKDQPVEILPMDRVIAETIAPKEFSASLITLFAGIATLLAAAGIYSVISYSVSRRTQEIGIRMALGAQRVDVTAMVLRHGLAVVAAGVVIGLVVTFAITNLIRSQLYQVSATDPVTYVAVCVLLLLVAVLACYVPARRASRVDPMTALRHE